MRISISSVAFAGPFGVMSRCPIVPWTSGWPGVTESRKIVVPRRPTRHRLSTRCSAAGGLE